MAQNKTHSIIILSIMVMFLLLLLGYFVILQPSFDSLKEQKDEVARLEDQASLLQRALANKKDKEKLSDDIQEALPLWDNTEQMIAGMKALSAQTSTKLSSISFNVVDSNSIHSIIGAKEPLFPNVGELKVQAVVQGDYNEIRSWLVELQKLPRVVVVDSVRFSLAITGETAAEVAFTGYFDPTYGYLLENPIVPGAGASKP
ncbi:hypothetical protein [Paenibacillus sp. PL2-23]|uniref:hypothetical protein n=1 Tax=Paenibacillus sp. PL2-23 TaxID=2100729 RepID=UPI0030FA1B4F